MKFVKKTEKIVKELSDEELMEITGGYYNFGGFSNPNFIISMKYGVATIRR